MESSNFSSSIIQQNLLKKRSYDSMKSYFDDKNIVLYDLETNGLDYYTTCILQMSLLNDDGSVLLNKYVFPLDERVEGTHIHGIDSEKLVKNNAITTYELFTILKKIIRELFGRESVYFIAYNNFGYDQIILENNFKKCNMTIPQNWYFIDLFPIVKELHPSIKPNFKLATVYSILCKDSDENIKFHCALEDTKCLHQIFMMVKNNNDEIFEKYTRPLIQSISYTDTPINTYTAYHESMNTSFNKYSIFTIGDLYEIFLTNNFDEKNTVEYLRNIVGIYSNYFLKTIMQQLKVMSYHRNKNNYI